jgi:hypothetical protein
LGSWGNEMCICVQSSSCCITWYTKGYAADSSSYVLHTNSFQHIQPCANFSIVCFFFTNDNICVYLRLQNIKLVTLCNKDWTQSTYTRLSYSTLHKFSLYTISLYGKILFLYIIELYLYIMYTYTKKKLYISFTINLRVSCASDRHFFGNLFL